MPQKQQPISPNFLPRLPEVKEQILVSADEQAEVIVGDAATYTIIDWAKENADSLLTNQPITITKSVGII